MDRGRGGRRSGGKARAPAPCLAAELRKPAVEFSNGKYYLPNRLSCFQRAQLGWGWSVKRLTRIPGGRLTRGGGPISRMEWIARLKISRVPPPRPPDARKASGLPPEALPLLRERGTPFPGPLEGNGN